MDNPTIVKTEIQTIKAQMKTKGLRITPQRLAVYANLLHRDDHPTVEAILRDINCELPIASKASVYSALTILREVGLVREVLLDEGVTRYDARIAPHHHIICQSCGAIADLDWDAVGELPIHRLPPGFQLESYEVILKGKCDCC
ncbi:MAG: Fur family transcriptional regulator [Cyanobacteria bacterium P01_E01_bin.42]